MKNPILIKKQSSVFVAKQRLEDLLTTDRVNCAPELVEQMEKDLYGVLSKYIEIHEDSFQFKLTRNDIFIRFAGEK